MNKDIDRQVNQLSICDTTEALQVPTDHAVATLLEHLAKLINLFSQTLNVMAKI
jgi:hypothetical protein